MSAGWYLIAVDVPDRYGGIVARLRFHPARESFGTWYLFIDPNRRADARAYAKMCLSKLRELGIAHRWREAQPRRRAYVTPARPRQATRGLSPRAQRVEDKQFAEYRREMSRPLVAPSVLPEPIGAAGVDRRPGLSKAAPKRT
jgi:hypothetical protein